VYKTVLATGTKSRNCGGTSALSSMTIAVAITADAAEYKNTLTIGHTLIAVSLNCGDIYVNYTLNNPLCLSGSR